MRRTTLIAIVALAVMPGCSQSDSEAGTTSQPTAAPTTQATADTRFVSLIRCEDALGAAYMHLRAAVSLTGHRAEVSWADGVEAFNRAQGECAGACEDLDEWFAEVAPDDLRAAEKAISTGTVDTPAMLERLKYPTPESACG